MIGALIAVGRTSKVYRYGSGAVAKVLEPGIPAHWARAEADLTDSVRNLGVAAPEVLDVIEIDGRPAILLEHIVGPTMWQLISDKPSSIRSLVGELAALQRSIHRAGVPESMPGQVDRLCTKIAEVDLITAEERAAAIELVRTLPRGAALLHGDLHPGNVLVADGGMVAIDWFDASVGHPAGDVTRSSLLIGVHTLTDRGHLPGATDEQLTSLHAAYLSEMGGVLDDASEFAAQWRAVSALSRLAEGTDDDAGELLRPWREYRQSADAAQEQ